jgi:hypothetical protein
MENSCLCVYLINLGPGVLIAQLIQSVVDYYLLITLVVFGREGVKLVIHNTNIYV